MVSTVIKFISGLASALLAAAFIFISREDGADKEKLKNAEKTLEDIAKGNLAASTDEYDSELFERYGK